MRKTALALLCGLAACGDNLDRGTPPDARDRGDAPIDNALVDGATQTQILAPTPYLQREDSPFSGLATWNLEDFEDEMLDDVPGTTANAGAVATGTIYIDSVDGDDGLSNNSCAGCTSWLLQTGPLRFTFAASTPGGLPTHAGLVWTDAGGGVGATVTFEAFDGDGNSLGTASLPSHSDAPSTGTTAEDRFFGVIAPAGVGAIEIKNDTNKLEIDHVQWGR